MARARCARTLSCSWPSRRRQVSRTPRSAGTRRSTAITAASRPGPPPSSTMSPGSETSQLARPEGRGDGREHARDRRKDRAGDTLLHHIPGLGRFCRALASSQVFGASSFASLFSVLLASFREPKPPRRGPCGLPAQVVTKGLFSPAPVRGEVKAWDQAWRQDACLPRWTRGGAAALVYSN